MVLTHNSSNTFLVSGHGVVLLNEVFVVVLTQALPVGCFCILVVVFHVLLLLCSSIVCSAGRVAASKRSMFLRLRWPPMGLGLVQTALTRTHPHSLIAAMPSPASTRNRSAGSARWFCRTAPWASNQRLLAYDLQDLNGRQETWWPLDACPAPI